MNKVVFGLVLGGLLGILDGLTAWFTPEVRPMILGIVLGSTFKGLLAGVLIGWFAKKVELAASRNRLRPGRRAAARLRVLRAMPSETGKHYYFEIMLPGAIVGAIVGYATQKQSGRIAQPART